MPTRSRIYEMNMNNDVTDETETGRCHKADMHEAQCEFAMMSESAKMMFAPYRALLRMVHECNLEMLRTYEAAVWIIPTVCGEWIQRSFSIYVRQQSAEGYAKAPAPRWGVRNPVDCIDHAMDVVIGDQASPPERARTARAA